MPGSGIWLDDATYLQTQGQLWAHQQVNQLQNQWQAGQSWGQDALERLQSMVPSVPTPTPAPLPIQPAPIAAPEPIPTPTPVPAPTPMPSAQVSPAPPPPAPAPVAPAPPPPSMAAPMPSLPDMAQAGQDWASQQIQNLLNPPSAAGAPQSPGTIPTPTPSGAPPGAISGPSGPTPAAPPTATPPPTPGGDLQDYARQAAQRAGIDPDIFVRQIQQESGFNPNAKSPAGATGIAQFMPGTAQGLGLDPSDPYASLDAAARIDAQNLQKYGGDWSKTLAAYNAGPGNVDKYGGVPPFAETQNYVSTILGGAKQAVQGAVQGVTQAASQAVNTAVQGVQSAVARVSQFAMDLSPGDAMAFCGPAAALAFAQTYGRNPTVDEAKQLAQQVGWNPNQGMAGVGSEVNLLKAMGVDAHATQGVDWAQVGRDAAGGNPVIIDTPGHYYYVDGYNADTGKLHVGTSGTDLKGGSEWMSPDQINAMPQSGGAARAAIFADHPLAQSDGFAQSTATQPVYMGTLQPATPTGLANVGAAVQSKVQDVQNAVQNVGGQVGTGIGQLGDWYSQQQQQARQTLGQAGIDYQPTDWSKPWLPQGGIDPLGQLQTSLPLIGRGVQQGDIGDILGGTARTALALGSALPGTGGATSAAAEALPQVGVEAVPWSERSLAALQGGLSEALPVSAIPWSERSLATLQRGPEDLPAYIGGYSQRGITLDPLTGQEYVPPGALSPYSPRGIKIDPLTGQEMLSGPEPPLNTLNQAMAANPEATRFMRTAGNQFEPVVIQQAQDAADVLTGLQNMAADRRSALMDTLQQMTARVDQAATDVRPQAEVQAELQSQLDMLKSRALDLLGDQGGQASAAFARLLGGGAAGGYGTYQATDPNDPNRWLKVAAGAGAGALAAGPGLDLVLQAATNPEVRDFLSDESGALNVGKIASILGGGGVVPQDVLESVRSANLNQNVYQPIARQGILPQVADVTKQLILSNPATHIGNAIGNTLEILRSPIALTLGGRPQDAVAGISALTQAIPEASRAAWSALNGQQVATLGTAASQIPLSQPVYRALGAVDTFSRTLGEYQGLAERASQLLARAGVSPSDPGAINVLNANADDLLAAARAQGARSVFQPVRDATQGTSFLDNLAHTYSQYKEGLLNSPNLRDQALGTLLDFELPFAGIPMRLLEVGAARAPGIAQVTGIGRALAAGRAGDMPAMQRAIGETTLETGIQALIAKGISDGNIVGPDNPDHPGGAIRIGGQWFNFDRMAGGFALPMQIMAGFAEAYNKAGIDYISPYAGQTVGGVNRGALDRLAQQTAAGLNAALKPFANAVPGEAIMQVLTAIGGGGATQFMQQQAQDAIARVSQPGFARFLENLTDPVAREIQRAGPDSLWQPTAAAIPGLAQLLPPKIDPTTGQPMPRTSFGLGQVVGAENPHLSAITQEANDLRMKYGYQVNPLRSYPDRVSVGNSVIPLSPSEQQAVAQLSGQRMAQLTARIEAPQYASLPPLQRALMLQSISRAADQLNIAALQQVLGPQQFRARVIQGMQLAGAPMLAQPQILDFRQSVANQQALQQALGGGGQGSALARLQAANQAALAG